MKYLLDTHALIWLARDEQWRFSDESAALIKSDPSSVCISAASTWEMASKNRIGKLPGVERFLENFEAHITSAGFASLGMSIRHSLLAGRLEGRHKDPFDRFLAAQAILEDLTLLSDDRALDGFGAKRMW